MSSIPLLIVPALLAACILFVTVKLIASMIRTATGKPDVPQDSLKGELQEGEWQALHRIADGKRVMSRERRQALLNETLQVDETDLALNRSGALSDKQKRSAVLLKVIVFLAIVGMGAVVLNVVFSSIVSVVFRMPGFFERYWRVFAVLAGAGAVLVLVVGIMAAFRLGRGPGLVVKCAQGKIVRRRELLPRHAVTYRFSFEMNGLRFYTHEDLLRLLDERKVYRVYYVDGMHRQIVGIEEMGDA